MIYPKPEDVQLGRSLYWISGEHLDKGVFIHSKNIGSILSQVIMEQELSEDERELAMKPLDNNDLISMGWTLQNEDQSGLHRFSDSDMDLLFDPHESYLSIAKKDSLSMIGMVQVRDAHDVRVLQRYVQAENDKYDHVTEKY